MKDGRKEEEQQSFAEPWSSSRLYFIKALLCWKLRHLGSCLWVQYTIPTPASLGCAFRLRASFFDLIWWFWFCGRRWWEEIETTAAWRRTRACIIIKIRQRHFDYLTSLNQCLLPLFNWIIQRQTLRQKQCVPHLTWIILRLCVCFWMCV